ncbi:hypothetical protein OUZ56_000344 [Daphnia magna]|uniref:Uncharacterized protein n=1 Tax=Daphnia magna TaxID=35525 RepID=A0ABQ9ZZE3_9CRUS|nr:hypothetical protein OUZ56_000344 [Daphnia magna]
MTQLNDRDRSWVVSSPWCSLRPSNQGHRLFSIEKGNFPPLLAHEEEFLSVRDSLVLRKCLKRDSEFF